MDLSEIVEIIITDNFDDVATVEKQLSNCRVRVLSKRDLITMKRRSGRQQDLVDIAVLEKI